MERIILHSDLNNFYASVECLKNPRLADIPVAVCGDKEKRHGIVLAKNELAKRFGVKTGEAIWQARAKCPKLEIVPPHFEEYMEFSRRARAVYDRYTDKVEPFGADECWLDASGMGRFFGGGEEIAEEIRKSIKRELGLTVSVGVSFNKIFAKLASDMKKPDAVTVLSRENYKEKIWNLPASDLLGVGRKTYARLMSCGIYTIGEIARYPADFFKKHFGKCGVDIWRAANGLDESEVIAGRTEAPDKSIGHGTTTPEDLTAPEEVRRLILWLCADIGHRMYLYEKRAAGVAVSVRDSRLVTKGWQTRLPFSTQSPTLLAQEAYALFRKNYSWAYPIRSVSVRAIDLLPADTPEQIDLFFDLERSHKTETIDKTVESIRTRFGKGAITQAVLL